MRRKLTAVFLGAALVLSAAGACPGSQDPASVEYEDCDAEDFRNREAECRHLLKPSTKPAAKTTPAKQPATKSTKR